MKLRPGASKVGDVENFNPDTELAKALAFTEAVRVADGRPERKRDRGPFAEMLAEAGFGPEKLRAVGADFRNGGDPGLTEVVGLARTEALADSFEAVAAAVEAGTFA